MMYRKNIAMGGSGGMVYTRNRKLHLLGMRHADRGAPVWLKYKLDLRNPGIANFPALNFNTNDLSCATGIAQIERINLTLQNRKKFIRKIVSLIKKSLKLAILTIFIMVFLHFIFLYLLKENALNVLLINLQKQSKQRV